MHLGEGQTRSIPATEAMRRSLSFVERKSSVAQRKPSLQVQSESRSHSSGLQQIKKETSSCEKGKPLLVEVLEKRLKPSKPLRKAMSCRGTSFLQHQKTLHSGWLSKTGGAWPRTVRRRWFEIKGDQLYYFRSKEDKRPINGIPLAGNRVERRTGDSSHPFQFEIVSGEQRVGKPVTETHESYLFIASSQNDLEKWIEAINIIIYTPFGGGMFGRAIDQTVRVDLRRGGGMVPIIVEKCVECIKNCDKLEEGVFRLSGNVQDVDDLKKRFNKGEIVDFVSEKHGIHTVASLLKMYLRGLPEPVVPFSFYGRFTTVVADLKDDQNKELKELIDILDQIPHANFNTLKYISRFLHEFQMHQEVTKMTLENLAVVFGPNIISPLSENPQVLMESSSKIAQVTEFLIKYHAKLFPVTDSERYYTPKSPDTTPPRQQRQMSPTLSLDSPDSHAASHSDLVKKSATFPRLSRTASASSTLSIGGALNGLQEGDEFHDYETQVHELVAELELQRSQFEGQVTELESKVDAQEKIIAMLKLRLHEEHKARTSAEKRLELYRLGIEEYCQKFGHININIP